MHTGAAPTQLSITTNPCLAVTDGYTTTVAIQYDIGNDATLSPGELARCLAAEYGVTEEGVVERVEREIVEQVSGLDVEETN